MENLGKKLLKGMQEQMRTPRGKMTQGGTGKLTLNYHTEPPHQKKDSHPRGPLDRERL